MSKYNVTIPEPIKESVNLLGEDIIFEMNHYAYKADAAITIQKGETVIMVAISGGKENIDANFLPLSVEYIEKFYAGGVISSSRFVKREMRPSDDATLKARQVDHAIRSLFPKSWRKPISVVVTVLAYDGINDPEQLSVIGTSTALMLSSIPFAGPSGSIKVVMNQEDKLVWAPTEEEEEHAKMDMIVSVVGESILNIEGWAQEVSEDVMSEVMQESVKLLQPVFEFQIALAKKYGKEKQAYEDTPAPEALISAVKEKYADRIKAALLDQGIRMDAMIAIKKEVAESDAELSSAVVDEAVEYVARKIMRAMVLEEKERTSGRDLDEVRTLKIEAGVLPRVHGSGVFTRGITQCLSVLTLGSTRMAQTLESFEGEDEKRFMHHYSSPNYSFGDAGRFSYYPGRREIGHGNIGENAIKPMLPSEEDFPYTIRVSSEIMSSNGSTSMAATCASVLALLDGGVPLKSLVAGVAVGLVTDDKDLGKYALLTDMEDVEDFYGDMDFKVTGTKKGVTAIQMDNKLKGVPVNILQDAFQKSKVARLFILDEMEKVIAEPRAEISQYAPKIEKVSIDPEKIGELIGPGGKVIKEILEKCEQKVEIDIQDDGMVYIFGVDKAMREKALKLIDEIVGEVEVGLTYDGVVNGISNFGAFVTVPGDSGLVHVSEIKDGFVQDVKEHLNVGDKVRVKVLGKENGRIKLSIKQADK